METNIPIPSTPSEITPKWIQLVTGHNCLPDSITIKGGIQEGFGFLSSMFRVAYKTTNDNHSIIVKLLPKDLQMLEFTVTGLADQREIQFYSVVLPDLIELVPCLEENVCKFYHGQVRQANVAQGISRESMLVIEDLNLKGFEMMPFSGEPSEQIRNSAVKFVAQLHFAANAVSVKKRKSLPQLYPFLQGLRIDVGWQKVLETMDIDGLPYLESFLKAEGLYSVWENYKRLNPLYGELVRIVETMGRHNPCLIHTDIWPPNIMVNGNLPPKFIDWQWLGYRDATYELSLMLMTVIPKEELTKAKLTETLKTYWIEYERLCASNEEFGDRIPRRRWDEFENTFFTWGCAWAYLWMLPGFAGNFEKDRKMFVNIFRVLCEEIHVVEFLLDVCKTDGKIKA